MQTPTDSSAAPGDAATNPPDVDSATATDGGQSNSDGGATKLTTIAMPIISRSAPAFASTGDPTVAHDTNPSSNWSPTSLPGWIAYDLSATPAAQRQTVLFSAIAIHAGAWLLPMPSADQLVPTAYTIESNTAAGGGMPPTTGWTQLVSVTNNQLGTMQHIVALAGANWIRMSITAAGGATSVGLDVDVFSAPNGASNDWLFMGDSITYITFTYPFSDLPNLVETAKAGRWPSYICGAIGGTSAGTAVSVIDDTMSPFVGRYVILAYGTNDHIDEFPANMEMLVQKVIAAGKVPVVPHIPWSDTNVTEVQMENAAIDALYSKYPAIVKGPDLWAAFLNRPDLIPSGDVHPNAAGEEVLRQSWATTIAGIP